MSTKLDPKDVLADLFESKYIITADDAPEVAKAVLQHLREAMQTATNIMTWICFAYVLCRGFAAFMRGPR